VRNGGDGPRARLEDGEDECGAVKIFYVKAVNSTPTYICNG
jgi:hypothetical protein